MRGHDLAVLNDAAYDLVGVLLKFQFFVSLLDEVGLDRERCYYLEDVHGLEDAIGAEDHEIVGLYLDVVADHVRDAAEIGLQFPLHLVLIIFNGFVLELSEAS